MEKEIKEELKIATKRAEETLMIIIDHFKDMEERMEELEEKIILFQSGTTPIGNCSRHVSPSKMSKTINIFR